jgi:hypothetical protein
MGVLMKILYISPNAELLALGAAYLQALGFLVVPASAVPCEPDLSRVADGFDLVILCHTCDRDQKRRIAGFLRTQCPSAQILELYLSEAPVTHGTAVQATTEFHHLMRMLASERVISQFDRPLWQPASAASMASAALIQ